MRIVQNGYWVMMGNQSAQSTAVTVKTACTRMIQPSRFTMPSSGMSWGQKVTGIVFVP